MALKPLELREMTPEEREKRDLAITQARESEKADETQAVACKEEVTAAMP